jgi:hypothetical protein
MVANVGCRGRVKWDADLPCNRASLHAHTRAPTLRSAEMSLHSGGNVKGHRIPFRSLPGESCSCVWA